MKHFVMAMMCLALTGCSNWDALKSAMQLKELSPADATALAAMPVDPGARVTVRGRVSTLLFAAPGTMGMMVVHEEGGTQRFAFSTAPTRDLAKQGFTRFSLSPGQEVVVTGMLVQDGGKIAGYTAARADLVVLADGKTVFDRGAL
jgi:hypothetical protein